MSLVAPWALGGLAALPVLWWLHRRTRRPLDVVLPSLMFLQDEDEATRLRRGRRIDWVLLLTLATAAAMVLAAVGPVIETGARGRRIRVVHALADHDVADLRHGVPDDPAFAALRAAADGGDVFDVVFEPPVLGPGVMRHLHARPSVDALLAAARAGEASVRYVVSDVVPDEPTPGVHWIGVGRPDLSKTVFLAASVAPQGDDLALHLVLHHDGPVAITRTVRATWAGDGSAEAAVDLPQVGARSLTLQVPAADEIELAVAPFDDDARVWWWGQEITLTRRPVGVWFAPGLPPALVRAVRAALEAAGGRPPTEVAARERAHLVFTAGSRPALPTDDTPPTALHIDFVTDAAGRGPVPPEAVEVRRPQPLVRDVPLRGVAWRLPSRAWDAPGFLRMGGPRVTGPERTTLLGFRRGETVWPLLESELDTIHVVPDLLADGGAALESPFLPILIENALFAVHAGPDAGLGYRTAGLVSLDGARVGRDVKPFDPATLRRTPRDFGAPPWPLRPLLIALALALLAALTVVGLLPRR